MISSGNGVHLSEDGEAMLQCDTRSCATTVAATNAGRELRWYAIQTFSRHEKRVRDHLQSRQVECFLPLYEAVHHWKNGCKVRVELPLFPTYMFVKIDLRDRVRVLEVPGICSLVGAGRGPLPLPDTEIQSLCNGLKLHKFEPHPYLTVGQKVMVKSGPLAGLTGVLVRKSESLRVVLSVDLIRQSVAVDVDLNDVEPVPAIRHSPAVQQPSSPGTSWMPVVPERNHRSTHLGVVVAGFSPALPQNVDLRVGTTAN